VIIKYLISDFGVILFFCPIRIIKNNIGCKKYARQIASARKGIGCKKQETKAEINKSPENIKRYLCLFAVSTIFDQSFFKYFINQIKKIAIKFISKIVLGIGPILNLIRYVGKKTIKKAIDKEKFFHAKKQKQIKYRKIRGKIIIIILL